MGMDTVELVIEVEDAFGICIPDADAEKMMTVGELHEYILERISLAGPANQLAQEPVCITARCFYRVRAALIEILGLERKAFTPRTPLESLLPVWGRRHLWEQFEQKLQMRLPYMRRPSWMGPLLFFSTAAVALFAAIGVSPWSSEAAAVLFCLFWFVFLVVAYVLTMPMAVIVPAEPPTLGGLVRNIADLNRSFLHGVKSMSRDEVWRTLQAIIVEQLGVKPSEVRPEASFVKDLGAD